MAMHCFHIIGFARCRLTLKHHKACTSQHQYKSHTFVLLWVTVYGSPHKNNNNLDRDLASTSSLTIPHLSSLVMSAF